MAFTIEHLAEDAMLLRFGDSIDAAINTRVHAAAHALRAAALPGVTDISPAYASLLLRFDPIAWNEAARADSFDAITAQLRSIVANSSSLPLPRAASSHGGEGWGEGASLSESTRESNAIEIPVLYGGDSGPDLDAVATHAGLSQDELVDRHTAATYTVAMLGFAPGFPYLLGLDPALHMARRANPRVRVATGSVAIGGAQTGIYPCELPGGWNLLGRTPVSLFDPRRELPALLAPGNRVRFRAIDADEFTKLTERSA